MKVTELPNREIKRLTKKHDKNVVLRSIRDDGSVFDNHGSGWEFYTRFDATGVRRMDSIVKIMEADGWRVLG